MINRASLRVAAFLLILCTTSGFFLLGGVGTWFARNFWERELRQVQVDTLQFAQEYRAGFLELNASLLRYRLGHAPEEQARFRETASALLQRLRQLDSDAFVPESKEILAQLTDQFDRYRRHAEALFQTDAAPSASNLLSQVDTAAERILTLDMRLSNLQGQELGAFVTRARRYLDQLWSVLYVSMGVMLLSGVILAWVAYRDLVAPLRRKVVRSRRLLEQQEKLTSLGLLTAGLAHEIRNPLNSIKARLFTQRRVMGNASPGLEDNRIIEEEVDRLEGILTDALAFARPAPPSVQRLQLGRALLPWCDLLEPSLRKDEIELKAEFDADPEVLADLNQLKQAVLNLVKNAAESIGRKGTITLRVLPAFIRRLGRKEAAVAIEVQDTGPGIAPDVQKRLFDPFFTTKENGTGLGLSIAARIVHAHRGLIEFDSPGSGAVFRLVLPAMTQKG